MRYKACQPGSRRGRLYNGGTGSGSSSEALQFGKPSGTDVSAGNIRQGVRKCRPPWRCTTHPVASGASIYDGTSFKIHQLPQTSLFAAASVPVPDTKRGSEKSEPLFALPGLRWDECSTQSLRDEPPSLNRVPCYLKEPSLIPYQYMGGVPCARMTSVAESFMPSMFPPLPCATTFRGNSNSYSQKGGKGI